MTAGRSPIAYESETRFILHVAMALFIYTVVVGILNGLDLVDFPHKWLLAHLHVGTLGWITMMVFAGALWLFGTAGQERDDLRWVARAAPVIALGYNIAFFTTDGYARPIMGTLMMLTIIAFGGWGFARARTTTLSVPHLGILAGLGTSVIGAVFGILNGVRIAQEVSGGTSGITERVAEAHPATMVVGFLVPVGMAFAEWVLRPESTHDRATRAGWLQIGLPFLGGVALVVGILLDATPIIGLSLPLEIIGVLIFAWRMFPVVRRVSWVHGGLERHGAVAALFVLVNIGLFVYLIANYIDDFEAAPRRLALALDHSIFVGVLTSTILALIARMSSDGRPEWVNQAVFWGFSMGIAGFIVGLVADLSPVIRVFTPLLGASILLAIAVSLLALLRGESTVQGGASTS